MKFTAINASIAWHAARQKREASPLVRQLRQPKRSAPASEPIEVRETASGYRAYTKHVPNRTALGVLWSDKASDHGISLPYVSILGRAAA